MAMYPGWSARDNYAKHKKKRRKRDKIRDGGRPVCVRLGIFLSLLFIVVHCLMILWLLWDELIVVIPLGHTVISLSLLFIYQV